MLCASFQPRKDWLLEISLTWMCLERSSMCPSSGLEYSFQPLLMVSQVHRQADLRVYAIKDFSSRSW
jgi:hypothetical protein